MLSAKQRGDIVMYQIEFLCHVGDKAEIRVLDTVRLVGDGDLARVVTQAEELFS
jgi:hypothetical protein